MDDPKPLHDRPTSARIEAIETLITAALIAICDTTPGLTARLQTDVAGEADGLDEVGSTDAAAALRSLWQGVRVGR